MSEIKRPEINYKTDELLENFRAFGSKDLYIVNELNGQMIDVSSDPSSYGIFVGDQLGARITLLKKGDIEEIYFPGFEDYVLLRKLEVLPRYQSRGYASELIDFAESFNMPTKTTGGSGSKDFFLHHGLTDVEAKSIERHDVLLWKP